MTVNVGVATVRAHAPRYDHIQRGPQRLWARVVRRCVCVVCGGSARAAGRHRSASQQRSNASSSIGVALPVCLTPGTKPKITSSPSRFEWFGRTHWDFCMHAWMEKRKSNSLRL